MFLATSTARTTAQNWLNGLNVSGQGVYLLHIEPAFKGASHYVGYADDVERRMVEHLTGRGAAITKAALEAGCTLTLVRFWAGATMSFEYWLKVKQKNSKALCPCARCGGEKAMTKVTSYEGLYVPKGVFKNRGKGSILSGHRH